MKEIKSALISVFYKDGLEPVIELLKELGVKIYSTGGTAEFIRNKGVEVIDVEDITGFPSILGGRVKTLHPGVFGGILARRDNNQDIQQLDEYEIPFIDLVIVDLYPFEETLRATKNEQEIIEKIDIGGISLIRAAAKNYADTLIVSSKDDYGSLVKMLKKNKGATDLDARKKFAAKAFLVTSYYDMAIHSFFRGQDALGGFYKSIPGGKALRYGENPHQKAIFYGDIDKIFNQLNGKDLSFNNLVDINAGIQLIDEFDEPAFAVIKHTNACGLAVRDELLEAWHAALEGDPISVFGGIVVANRKVDAATAEEINKIFIEVIIAPGYEKEAVKILKSKKNRMILERKPASIPEKEFKSLLNGVIEQDRDIKFEAEEDFKYVTDTKPNEREVLDMIFANIIVKHLKSNAIVLVKNKQLIGAGTGQTSRVDALKQAIDKARSMGFDTAGAVMASDAFFPFPDSVQVADKAGITAVIQPGGSIRDQESIDYCNSNQMSMVFTGTRHFKH